MFKLAVNEGDVYRLTPPPRGFGGVKALKLLNILNYALKMLLSCTVSVLKVDSIYRVQSNRVLLSL